MKRTLITLLLVTITMVSAFAQDNSYKIFDRKRGTAYHVTLAGADDKYIYVFTPGISQASSRRNTDAVLCTYRITDFAPVKSKETDFTFKGKDLDGAAVHIFSKYAILTYRNYDRTAMVSTVTWIALDRETLEPAKDGAVGGSKLNGLDFVNVRISPDGQTMMMLYGNHEKELISCFDKDMNLLWESDFNVKDDDRIISDHIDNNQNVYILVKSLPSHDGKTPGVLRIMTIKNKGASKDMQPVSLPDSKSLFSYDATVSGDGIVFIGGIYSNSGVSPDGVFTLKIDPSGSKSSDTREMPYLNKKSIKWHTEAGVNEKGEFYFNSQNKSHLEVTTYSSSGAPSGGYGGDLVDGYVAVYANTSGKIDHAMNWHHLPIPVPDEPVALAQMVYNGKPYLFTDYSKQQFDKWEKTDYSKDVPSVKERIKSPTRQICSVTNFDAPAATKPTQLFTIDKGFFGCSAAAYVPSLHTMVFLGCITEGKYGQGYTNFSLGKTVLK